MTGLPAVEKIGGKRIAVRRQRHAAEVGMLHNAHQQASITAVSAALSRMKARSEQAHLMRTTRLTECDIPTVAAKAMTREDSA
jgi:hypothetical protein